MQAERLRRGEKPPRETLLDERLGKRQTAVDSTQSRRKVFGLMRRLPRRRSVGVNTDMKLAPGPAFRNSVFFGQPFARSTKLQACAIDDQMQLA